MQFKIDENLHESVAALLRKHGHDAVTVHDQHLTGGADDNLAEVCRLEARAILTLDLDFADIRAYPPGRYAGIVVFRLHRPSRKRVDEVLRRLIPLLETEPLQGRLWIVDDEGFRVRVQS
jgi:predicted nuclease of predicted toxin-antitoxin system